MFIGGVKEALDQSHGPARVGDRAMLKAWREHGAPGGLASDPLSGHECGDSRYLAIAFFDACLAQRLPEAASATQTLKPVDLKRAWLAAPDSQTAQPASEFTGNEPPPTGCPMPPLPKHGARTIGPDALMTRRHPLRPRMYASTAQAS